MLQATAVVHEAYLTTDRSTMDLGRTESLQCGPSLFLRLRDPAGAVSADIPHFPARVLVIQGGKGLLTGTDPDPRHGSARLLVGRAIHGSPDLTSGRTGPWSPWSERRQHSMVTRPRRLTGISGTTPIDWLQRVSGARRPRVT